MKNPMDDRLNDGKAFASKEEMTTALRDPRYSDAYRGDPAYRERVTARVAATNFEGVTGVLLNKQHPLADEGLSDVDQVAAHMPMGYNTIADFTRMMRSHEYKTNPAYRLAVEGAIAQATPNWKPRTGEESHRVEIEPKIPGSGYDPNNSPASAAASEA